MSDWISVSASWVDDRSVTRTPSLRSDAIEFDEIFFGENCGSAGDIVTKMRPSRRAGYQEDVW
jgi:hypothetical protein